MEKKIREYLDRKLDIYTNTKKMIEFKEKLLSMMLDKYRDCRSFGMTEKKSYALAISVMSNYSEEERRYSAKTNDDGINTWGSGHLFGGIA